MSVAIVTFWDRYMLRVRSTLPNESELRRVTLRDTQVYFASAPTPTAEEEIALQIVPSPMVARAPRAGHGLVQVETTHWFWYRQDLDRRGNDEERLIGSTGSSANESLAVGLYQFMEQHRAKMTNHFTVNEGIINQVYQRTLEPRTAPGQPGWVRMGDVFRLLLDMDWPVTVGN